MKINTAMAVSKGLNSKNGTNNDAAQVVYIGTCSCNNEYVGETSRNLQSCIDEHLDTSKLSEPARHLYSHPEHFFIWKSIVSI